MKPIIHVPNSQLSAGREIRLSLVQPLASLSHEQFIRAWAALAYLFPGLHPDGFEDADSGWPRVLKRFATEAWRRMDTGDLADSELYSSDAAWSGIYDRMSQHTLGEIERRLTVAAACGG